MYTIKGSTLGAIADSVRSKTGGTEAMTPEEMAAQIAGIETGGGGVDINAIADGSFGGEINIDKSEVIARYAFYQKQIEGVCAPIAANIEEYAFGNCGALKKVNVPSAAYIRSNAFGNCTSIENLDLPSAEYIDGYAFYGASKFATLVLRRNTAARLANATAFYYTPFANNGTGGILYVPAALVDSYKAANRWSTILSYQNNQIRALEDYTVDGTVAGELDLNKI